MKTKTITQIGFVISGTAYLTLWGGELGTIEMSHKFLPYDLCTPKNILRCVNDAGFGVQSIDSADIDISIKYDNGSIEYDRMIDVYLPIHTQFFNKKIEIQKRIEVSVSFNCEMWELTNINELLPFHSETTFEKIEIYCKNNGYEITVVYGEDGEAL